MSIKSGVSTVYFKSLKPSKGASVQLRLYVVLHTKITAIKFLLFHKTKFSLIGSSPSNDLLLFKCLNHHKKTFFAVSPCIWALRFRKVKFEFQYLCLILCHIFRNEVRLFLLVLPALSIKYKIFALFLRVLWVNQKNFPRNPKIAHVSQMLIAMANQ